MLPGHFKLSKPTYDQTKRPEFEGDNSDLFRGATEQGAVVAVKQLRLGIEEDDYKVHMTQYVS
jgi:hypothetical protein